MAHINNKGIWERANKIIQAWAEAAKEASFGGVTYAAFQSQWEKSGAARKVIELAELQRELAAKGRDREDAALQEFCRWVVDGVKADPAFGPNSPLYRAMGYVPYDERSSGLTRKETAAEEPAGAAPDPTPTAEAA